MGLYDLLMSPWVDKQKALVVTEGYEIKGWLYNPGLSKTNRFFSNLLNRANKNFIAITDCEITYKNRQGEVEYVDFLQLNMKYIILIKPINEEEQDDEDDNDGDEEELSD